MNYHNYWEYTLLENKIPTHKSLQGMHTSDFLIIGGGIAGLHVALELIKNNVSPKDIILVEKTICGGGMSGKSGGFLTPDSELGLRSLEKRYGSDIVKKIREFGVNGQASIVKTTQQNNFNCDLRDQDSLLLGLGNSGRQACIQEHEARKEYGYDSELILDAEHLKLHNSGKRYTSGDKYNDCFGIDAFQYCQSLKQHLAMQGVRIFEFTEITQLDSNKASTNCGAVHFKHCFVCPGKVTQSLSKQKSKMLFGVMNFITVTEPLEEDQVKAIMPLGECMCWDTKLVFSYYRVIKGNRIILGGGNPISAFLPRDIQYDYAIQSTIRDFKKMFPSIEGVRFSEYWSGRIQVTKDLMPIIDTCNTYCNHTRVMGCAGLPRAAACGEFAVKKYFGNSDKELESVFSINRKWFIPRRPNNNIFKAIVFSISNARSLFWQKGY